MVAVALIGLLCSAVILSDRYHARGRPTTLHSSLSIYHRELATHHLDLAAVNKREHRSVPQHSREDNSR